MISKTADMIGYDIVLSICCLLTAVICAGKPLIDRKAALARLLKSEGNNSLIQNIDHLEEDGECGSPARLRPRP